MKIPPICFLLLLALMSALHAFDPSAIEREVQQLPASSPEQKLKKAVLSWCLEDAKASGSAGLKEDAEAVWKDIETMLPQNIGKAHNAPPNLFPPIPKPRTNPFLLDAVKRVEKLIAENNQFSKTASTDHIMDPVNGWRYATWSGEGNELTWALCHPQSPLASDERLVAPILRRFAEVYRSLKPGSKNLADFGCSPPMTEMYLLFRTRYPDLIPPSRRIAWEEALRINTEAILAQKQATYAALKHGTGYPNADFDLIYSLLVAGLVLNREDFRQAADNGLRLMETCLYPDGGYCYIGYQNEVLTYHIANIRYAARYWQITGSELAKSLVSKTRWYYPLSVEPCGVAEYATSPCWKHYWNSINGSDGALIVAGITGDAHNARISQACETKATFSFATFYRDDIAPVPVPDNFIVHDRNIQGARGRFDHFSFAATSRNLWDDNSNSAPNSDPHDDYIKADGHRGKSTYVGCMVTGTYDTKKNPWPLNAALDSVGNQVRVAPFDSERSGPGKSTTGDPTLYSLTQQEHNAALTSRDFAAVTTTHMVSGYKAKAIQFEGRQEWLLTANRLVGLVSQRALEAQQAYALRGCVTFVSGRGNGGVRKAFQSLAPDEFQYGALIAKIHAHDYAAISTEYTDVMNAGSGKAGRIVLLDKEAQVAGERTLIHYPKNTEHFYLVEIRPESSQPAESVTKLALSNGLVGIEITEGGRKLRLIHNPKSSPETYSDTLSWNGPIMLHRSGEEYRPAWIGEKGKEETVNPPTSIAAGVVNLNIPADGHIVLESASAKAH